MPYQQIVDYARSIGRYGPPKGYKLPVGMRAGANERDEDAGGGEGEALVKEEVNGAEGRGQETNGVGREGRLEGKGTENAAMSMLTGAEKAWLDPDGQRLLLPWPSEEMAQQGALAHIHHLLEKGMALEDVKIEGEEDKTMDVVADVVKTESGVHMGSLDVRRTAPQEEKPKVFGGFDLYTPDEEA